MGDQKPKEALDPGVRLLGSIGLALVVWAVTYVTALLGLGNTEHGPLGRALLAGVGIAGFILWVVVVARTIRAQDEFTQRIHLIGIAVAFALTALVSYAGDFLQRAGFIEQSPAGIGLWFVMAALWMLSLIGASRYYR